jgi:hypothetical protein
MRKETSRLTAGITRLRFVNKKLTTAATQDKPPTRMVLYADGGAEAAVSGIGETDDEETPAQND